MTKGHSSRGALLTANLPQLQNLIKRDPAGYKDEFLQQWNHYQSVMLIFEQRPDEQADRFRELVTFIAQVAQCYPEETASFPSQIASLLLRSFSTLVPDTRKTLVQNLVMLRNKGVIGSIELLQTLFPLLAKTTSAPLRSFIRRTILLDIRTANQKSQNHKLNRAVQAMLFGMLERGMGSEMVGDKGKLRERPADAPRQGMDEAVWAIALAKELWRKSVWNDEKTVSIVALGCLHPSTKVQKAAYYFFLGDDEDEAGSSDEEDEGPDIRQLKHQRLVKKKTRSEDRKIAKAMKVVKKKTKSKTDETTSTNFGALQLIRDPQTFAEKLHDHLQRYDKRLSLDHKVLIMQLLSRIMGYHKLCVLGFYGYIVKYLTYHQLRVTVILVSLAQSVHELTPPDVLLPVIRKIAQEFIHPGVGSEVIRAGLNAIREVCRRQPWSMEEDLLGDLVEYRKSRDKGVMVAARGLLQLYREVNPGLLKRRERGKTASMAESSVTPLPYGHAPKPAEGIEGLELLRAQDEQPQDGPEWDEWEGWDIESDSDASSSSDWIAVSSEDEGDIVISDSEEEATDRQIPTGVTLGTAPAQIAENLATTKILTPADFAILNKGKLESAASSMMKGSRGTKRKALSTANPAEPEAGTFVTEADIMGPRKRVKADYEERMASIHEGREGREKFGSKKGKKSKEVPSSTTNRQKARNKPVMMILSSNAVRGKKRASLREKQQRLRKGKRS
ncbi:protein required for actin cytoskeleton organization and cell cycle progression [Calocera viscosa TUFC12733]|uniref:Protein SDA1 n=1 Tax=Calocera viscosa (strain TUFC12733) TaxID=1330018 RepID=A0A167JLQ4_CALVF|nr:protein required for actin cytoskeleton organization and cell cycle progression [Calocera viscosa TUFC12733]